MNHRKYLQLGLLFSAFATGCGPSFTAATPPGFVELDADYGNYDYRATTAEGLVIGVREIEHDPEGDLDFWVRAIENELRARGGYALLENKPLKNAQGLAGRQLWFGHDEGQKPHLYMVTLFVTEGSWLSDGWIYVLEVGGTKEQLEKQRKQIDWAVDKFEGDV